MALHLLQLLAQLAVLALQVRLHSAPKEKRPARLCPQLGQRFNERRNTFSKRFHVYLNNNSLSPSVVWAFWPEPRNRRVRRRRR